MRKLAALLLLLVAGLAAPAVGAAHSAGERQQAVHRLAALRTVAPLALNGFSAMLFRHWLDPDRNGCDASEDTLIRDGKNVRRGPRCAIRSGAWVDQYSGKTYRNPRSLDADHLVPLANAWRSGAKRWTKARRTQYANDPLVLVVTSTRLDRQKGNRSPDQWKPPRRASWFAYAERWIGIKVKYHLAVTRTERAALRVLLAAEPASSGVPLIAGTTAVGSTLTATTGTWSGSPAPTLTRQWQRCTAAGCASVAGAMGVGYLLGAADVGGKMRVVVTATNDAGSAVAPSAQTVAIGIAPANSVPPAIAGATTVNATLTATDGTWSGSPAPVFTRQWQRCTGATCADIPGASGITYVPDGTNVNERLRVVVTATNSAGSPSAASAQTATIVPAAPIPVVPANLVSPTISGTAQVGATLTATDGTWSGFPMPAIKRQWQRCAGTSCANIASATNSTYKSVAADVGQRAQVVVTATNDAGSAAAASAQTAPITGAAGGGDPTIATAGDIACDPLNGNFHAGAGTGSACAQLAVSNLIFNKGFASVLPLGDNQYYCGGLSDFLQSYDLSWGRVLAITHPVVGNHEYVTSGGTGCDAGGTASGYFSYFGSRAGTPGQGYYSYDVGTWHVIALNSNCSNAGGCSATTPQGRWLAADLAAHQNACTLAYWHIPLFSSGGRAAGNSGPMWTALYNAGADVVLNGHDHIYERFSPQTAAGIRDDARGLREFIVGTGGANHTSLVGVAVNSELRNDNTFGILKLTLHATSYDWQFIPAPGTGTFTDSGSQSCH